MAITWHPNWSKTNEKDFRLLHNVSNECRIIMSSNNNEDMIIYEVLNDMCSIEWQRTTSIENKAICIIGFIGVLLVYSTNLGFSYLDEILSSQSLLLLYIACIISLGATFYTSTRALFYGKPIDHFEAQF
jgi:hypothetical protein